MPVFPIAIGKNPSQEARCYENIRDHLRVVPFRNTVAVTVHSLFQTRTIVCGGVELPDFALILHTMLELLSYVVNCPGGFLQSEHYISVAGPIWSAHDVGVSAWLQCRLLRSSFL